MSTQHFADILVQKSGRSAIFTYSIPSTLNDQILPGMVVKVPLRGRSAFGVVWQIKPYIVRGIKNVKNITAIIDPDLKLTQAQMELAKWMSDYFVAPLNICVFSFLPILQGRPTVKLGLDEIKTRHDETKNRLKLSDEQLSALDAIARSTKPVLLHGVTGSGKTEVYLRRAEMILSTGGQVLMLIPEIALTPQTLARFTERFGTIVAAWHSELKATERRRIWWQVRDQKIKLIVGSRSAIFLPFQNLKLLIIDEEHEHSYYQESAPRYDARTIAVEMFQRNKMQLIFGSATPSLERVWQASSNQMTLAALKYRVSARPTPETTLVDLRQEPTNQSLLSGPLSDAISNTLDNHRQTVILLNRRGHASSALCRACGFIVLCRNCDIPMTVHNAGSSNVNLQCHHCDLRYVMPSACPNCRNGALEYHGFGTERIAAELAKQFKGARVLRMDRDSTSKREMIDKMYHDFAARKYDILIGTQMIAKGWDVPSVDLVGVLLAESGLFLPDYHSSANTFNLLVQVAGRSGRGDQIGRTIIQTFNPESALIRAVAKHDFGAFVKAELKARRQFNYPPFSHIVRFVFQHSDVSKCQHESEGLVRHLKKVIENHENMLGSTPCYFERLRGKARWHIICKLNNDNEISAVKKIGRDLQSPWVVEVDPGQLL